ncbi:MAG: carboxypeptidase regulatory-like domain-containing protein [Halodesulfurarchaeum sp.]
MSWFQRLAADERGIEGLPVRLIIAFVVGVAALSVMLNMISGVESFAVAELDVKPEPHVIGPESQTVELTAIGSDDAPVAGATIVIESGTASLETMAVATTGPDGTATVRIDPILGPNQAKGSLRIDVEPPAGSNYMDRRGNSEITVLASGV